MVPRQVSDAFKGARHNDIGKLIRRKLEDNNDQLQCTMPYRAVIQGNDEIRKYQAKFQKEMQRRVESGVETTGTAIRDALSCLDSADALGALRPRPRHTHHPTPHV